MTAQRKPDGLGSVNKDGKRWRANGQEVQTDGTRKSSRKRFDTEAEAWEFLDALNDENERRTIVAGKGHPEKVIDLFEQWLSWKNQERKKSGDGKPDIQTLEDYKSTIRMYILPRIGDVELRDPHLKEHLQRLNDSLSDIVSVKTGKLLSHARKRNIWSVVRFGFKWAHDKGFLAINPTTKSNIIGYTVTPSNPRTKILSNEDADKFRAYIENHGCGNHANGVCRFRWELGVSLGRRQGECLGLLHQNVHIDRQGRSFIEVNLHAKSRPWKHGCSEDAEGMPTCGKKQGQYCPKRFGGGIHLLDGTKGGKQLMPRVFLDDNLVESYLEHSKYQREEAYAAIDNRTLDAKRSHINEKPVFTQPINQRLYTASLDVAIFKKILLAAGIKRKYHIHQLRHTAATDIADSNQGNITMIANILGHKSHVTTKGYIQQDLEPQVSTMENRRDMLAARAKKREAESANDS